MPRRPRGEVPTPEAGEQKELGKNNRILVKFMRHAERTPEDELTPQGMEETAEVAYSDKASGVLAGFDKVKAVGSDSGAVTEMPSSNSELNEPKAMPRSMGTAHIYAEGVAMNEDGQPVERYATRPRALLGLDGFKNNKPFNWKQEYNDQLPDNYEQLSETEKAAAAFRASSSNLNRLLTEKKGEAYRREVAGRYAMFVDRYLKMVDRIDSDTKVLIPAGAHGGFMEVFLHEVLKRRKGKGKKVAERIGFDDVAEIGGAFHPSEGFSIDITTDAEGKKQLKVIMDNQDRLKGEELTLDLDKIKKLVEDHKGLYDKGK